jgi:hypothetical protein
MEQPRFWLKRPMGIEKTPKKFGKGNSKIPNRESAGHRSRHSAKQLRPDSFVERKYPPRSFLGRPRRAAPNSNSIRAVTNASADTGAYQVADEEPTLCRAVPTFPVPRHARRPYLS